MNIPGSKGIWLLCPWSHMFTSIREIGSPQLSTFTLHIGWAMQFACVFMIFLFVLHRWNLLLICFSSPCSLRLLTISCWLLCVVLHRPTGVTTWNLKSMVFVSLVERGVKGRTTILKPPHLWRETPPNKQLTCKQLTWWVPKSTHTHTYIHCRILTCTQVAQALFDCVNSNLPQCTHSHKSVYLSLHRLTWCRIYETSLRH